MGPDDPPRKKHGLLVHTAEQSVAMWRAQAENDRRTAHALTNLDRPRAALVFAHLAVEKALKALYQARHEEHPPVSHNLIYLSERTRLLIPDDLQSTLDRLNEVSIVYLYSGTPEPAEDATALLAATDRLFDWITDHIASVT